MNKQKNKLDRLLTKADVEQFIAMFEAELNSPSAIASPHDIAVLRHQRDALQALLDHWPEGILP